MTPAQDPQAACGDDIRLLLADLAVISGTLSEIATVWRRATPYLPGLPVILPEQLQDAARQLAAGIQALGGPAPGPVRQAADQWSAFTEGIAAARAMTRGPGIPDLGDRGLWESLTAALHQAQTRLAALQQAPAETPPPAGA